MSAVGAGVPLAATRALTALGGDRVSAAPAACAACAIAGVAPAAVATPADRDELAAVVAAVAGADGALVALGRGAHRALGHSPERYDVALSTVRLTRVHDYTPADMTVTIEAGTTIADLQRLLAGEGQWLPVDPPLPEATTVGGLVAADLGGALRASAGRVRDLLLGVGVVTAAGRPARAGGKVVKNVAGYDLMKLFTGSLGTLAVVTEATFKVRPRPAIAHCLVVRVAGGTAPAIRAAPDADLAAALALADRLAGSGIDPLTATLVVDRSRGAAAAPELVVTLGGVAEDVAAARGRLLDLARAAAAEVSLDVESDDARARAIDESIRDLVRGARWNLVVRATVLPRRAGALTAAAAAALAATPARLQLDPRIGRVTLAVAASEPARMLATLAGVAATHGAHLVVERWPDALAASVEVWRPLPAGFSLMRRMKQALDPARTLAPGRFVGRL